MLQELENTQPHSDPLGELLSPEIIFGRSEAMNEVRSKIERIKDAAVPVLIRGESGTGKEVIAKFIHTHSSWVNSPFVKVHCPAIPATLLESELFGYEAGSFTGADRSKPGRVEAAHRGILFLDEIAELEPGLQVKLLHLLQDGHIFRIGAQEGRVVDARIICATHRQLEQEIARGRFRQDLFYRINVVTVHLPPLRDRKEDIPGMAQYFLRLSQQRFNTKVAPLSDEWLERLQEHDWPGNIRELENVIGNYVVLGPEGSLPGEENPIPQTFQKVEIPEGTISLRKIGRRAAREAERRVILRVLKSVRGNRKQAARTLNISYRALLYKLKEVGIPPKRVLEAQPEGAFSRMRAF
ncbi:MAG TPA: sigma-54 dependent transcriptional regulator [Candidatus Dormibacteraeota bacterium]|nr:sigma-54 dependent transcriptional regulator [Candidatus Dormibacteraeota bacterium]